MTPGWLRAGRVAPAILPVRDGTRRSNLPEMTARQTPDAPREELAYRANDDIEVWLFWRKAEDRLTVQVSDAKTNDVFEVEAPRDRALEVFYHPSPTRRSRPPPR